MDIQVAKINPLLALEIDGQLSNDGIRYFAPRLDGLGNWIMDLEMAQDNGLEFEIFLFDVAYFDLLERMGSEDPNIKL